MDTQNKERTKSADNTLANLADGLVAKTNKLIKQAKNEEDLKIGFEKILEPVLKDLGIKPIPKYEKSIFNAGRSDALHGQVVIEYELPGAFRSQRAMSHAFNQLVGYLQGLSQKEKNTLFIFESKFIGVGFDGERAKEHGQKEKWPPLEIVKRIVANIWGFDLNPLAVIAGRGFGTPSVMEHVGIPKFDPKNPLHQKLSEISKKCHQLKAEGKEKEVEKLEKQNDNLIKDLFRIKQSFFAVFMEDKMKIK